MTLLDGERQVAPKLDGIRRDHLARYEFAARALPPGSRVIDFACGVGYGSKILADAGHYARGFDREAEALAYAREHYASPQATFALADGNTPPELGNADAAVCFETIEHIEDPRPLLKALRLSAPTLIASVPNEEAFPWRGYDHHFRHYTKHEFAEVLRQCGWCVTEWHGQEGDESDVAPDVNGRTLVAIAARDELPNEDADMPGKHIVILGLGSSVTQYLETTKRLGGRSKFCDEVWAINALGDVFDCDLVFHMDDVRIQEVRAKAAPASNIAAMLRWLRTTKTPVVTSRAHPDYPALVEFPLEAVLNELGYDYFNSTAAYAVALAIFRGARKISCFGMDFTYPNASKSERGRACVEFWLGMASARGIKIGLPETTTLMDSRHGRDGRLYGYDTVDVTFNIQQDGSVKLDITPRVGPLPTAEEIEKAYDHAAPIAQQHHIPKVPA